MIQRILLPAAGDETSAAAADVAVELGRRLKAEVTCLAVVDAMATLAAMPVHGLGATYYPYTAILEFEDRMREAAQTHLSAFLDKAKSEDIEHATTELMHGAPRECIAELSRVHDLMIVGRGAHFRFNHQDETNSVGETLRHLLDDCDGPILCVSNAPLGAERVVVGIDGRPGSLRALRAYVQSGLLPDARIHLVHFVEKQDDRADLSAVQKYLDSHRRWSKVHYPDGVAKRDMVSYTCDLDADLIVLGAHGKGRLAEWALGRTAIEVIERATAPAFITP